MSKQRKILLLNPNKTEAMTVRMLQAAAPVVPDSVHLEGVTATRGFEYISSRAESQVAGEIVLEIIAAQASSVDAVVIAAFGDPGLHAARELFDIPVVGMAEAAMLTACTLGRRFCFVTFSSNLAPWYEESVDLAGLSHRFAGVKTPDASFQSVNDVQTELRAELTQLISQASTQADVAILSGAPLAGLAYEIQDAPMVLLDPIGCAVGMAQSLITLAPKGASAGRFVRPPAKPNDLSDTTLSRWIARKE